MPRLQRCLGGKCIGPTALRTYLHVPLQALVHVRASSQGLIIASGGICFSHHPLKGYWKKARGTCGTQGNSDGSMPSPSLVQHLAGCVVSNSLKTAVLLCRLAFEPPTPPPPHPGQKLWQSVAMNSNLYVAAKANQNATCSQLVIA